MAASPPSSYSGQYAPMVALMYYNVGIHNSEVGSKKWAKSGGRYDRLKGDIRKIFSSDHAIQILLLSEFGNMLENIDDAICKARMPIQKLSCDGVLQPVVELTNTKELFEQLLAELDLQHIKVEANPPYVALINSLFWKTEKCEAVDKICTQQGLKVQHLILRHVHTNMFLKCFNAHMPTSCATSERKRTCVLRMCIMATEAPAAAITSCGIGSPQPPTHMAWILGGDLNVDVGTMAKWCQSYVTKDKACMSTSGWDEHRDAQKADHALSQGLELTQVRSWVGIHSPPCASDVHDAVVVKGVLQTTTPSIAHRQMPGNWRIPGVALFDVPKTPKLSAVHVVPDSKTIEERSKPTAVNPPEPTALSSGDVHPTATTAATSAVGSAVNIIPDPKCIAVSSLAPTSAAAPPKDSNPASRSSDAAHPVAVETTTIRQSLPAPSAQSDDGAQSDLRVASSNILAQQVVAGDNEFQATEDVATYLDTIAKAALVDDAATATALPLAAQDLLQTIFLDRFAIRTREQVFRLLQEPIRRREEFVRSEAVRLSTAQPAANNGNYTVEQWHDWYATTSLSDEEMDRAVKLWKEDFPMHADTRAKVQAFQWTSSRSDKKKARELVNGAFKAYLHQECVGQPLAMAFLSHPPAKVDTLLAHWAHYMNSSEYEKQRRRSRKVIGDNAADVQEKEEQMQVKIKVHALRHQLAQMRSFDKKKHTQARTGRQARKYQRWLSGDLQRELDALTLQHGYGTMPSTGTILKPPRLTDKLPQ